MILLFFVKMCNLVTAMGSFYKLVILFFSVLVCLCSSSSKAQAVYPATQKNVFVTGFPLLYYTPETRFAFGLSGLCIFKFKNDTNLNNRSSVNISAIYTQNKQALFTLPYAIFSKDSKYRFYGEVTYNNFNYNFYGVGNRVPHDFVERYGVSFPRFRFSGLRRVSKHLFVGVRYAYDKFRLFNLDTNGLLIKGSIKGSTGGTVSGFGAIALFDSRNALFFSTKGCWAEFVFYHDDPITGSSFNYNRVTLDVVKYFHFSKHVFALNAYSLFANTDLPFFQMAGLGGTRRMRGFYESRYRNNNAIVIQAEYRRVVWGPLGFSVFASVGQIAERYTAFTGRDFKCTGGLGLRCRVDKKQNLFLRFDLAYGNKSILPYLTIAEPF